MRVKVQAICPRVKICAKFSTLALALKKKIRNKLMLSSLVEFLMFQLNQAMPRLKIGGLTLQKRYSKD